MDQEPTQDDWLEDLSPDERREFHEVTNRYESQCREQSQTLDFEPFLADQNHLREPIRLQLVYLRNQLNREFKLSRLIKELLSGDQIKGRYEFLSEVGTGTHGRVFLARDLTLQRLVAIKIPKRALSKEADREAVLNEARYASRLRHPNVVSVLSFEEFDEQLVIVSEFIEGATLHHLLTTVERFPPERAVEIVRKLADALQHAHDLKVIHRDVKPGNVIIDDRNEPQLTDFGIATSHEVNVESTLAGTRPYMAPEQLIEGVPGDEQSDQYALGILLYELVVGQRPDRRSNTDQFRKIRSHADRDLESICRKATSEAANQRYPSCRDFQVELARWERGVEVAARKRSPPEKIYRFGRKYRFGSLLLVLLFVASVFATLFALAERKQRKAALAAQEDSASNAYANSMMLALNAIESSDPDAALVELAKQIPVSGANQRGPEWDMVWNRATTTGMRLFGHRQPVTQVDFSANGEWLASASEAGVVRIWRPETGECEVSFRSFDFVWGLRFLPNSDFLITNGPDTIEIRSTVDWSIKKRITGFPSVAKTLGVSPDGSRFAIGTTGGSIRVWDSSFELEHQRELENFEARGCAFSPDGSQLAFCGKMSNDDDPAGLFVWNLSTDEMQRLTGHQRLVQSVKYRDGKTIVSASWDGTVRKWNLDSGKSQVVGKQTGIVRTVEDAGPDLLFSGGESGVLTGWDNTGDVFSESARVGMIQDIAYDKDSHLIAVGGFGIYPAAGNARGVGSNLSLWKLDGNKISRIHQPATQPSSSLPDWLEDMAIGPNGEYAIASIHGELIVQHSGGGESRLTYGKDRPRGGVDFDSTGKRVVYSNHKTLRLFQVNSDSVDLLQEVASKDFLLDPTFIDDSRICVVREAGDQSVVEIRDADSLQVIDSVPGLNRARITLKDNNSAIFIGDDDGTVRLWDLENDPVTVVDTARPIKSLSHANGKLAISHLTGEVSVYDEETKALIAVEEMADANSIALSPDGTRLAIGGNGAVQLFDTRSGNLVFRETVGTGEGRFVAFNEDNSLVLAVLAYPGKYQLDLYRFSSERKSVVDECFALMTRDWTSRERQMAVAVACLDACRLKPDSEKARMGLLALQLGGNYSSSKQKELSNALTKFLDEPVPEQALKFEATLAKAISTTTLCKPANAEAFLNLLERSLTRNEYWTRDGKGQLLSAIKRLRESLPPRIAYP